MLIQSLGALRNFYKAEGKKQFRSFLETLRKIKYRSRICTERKRFFFFFFFFFLLEERLRHRSKHDFERWKEPI